MALNLIADRVVQGKIYPSLARFQAEPYTLAWRQFHQHWPNTIPLRLQEYFQSHGVALQIFAPNDSWPNQTYYPIALSWFDFGIDYLALIPAAIVKALQKHKTKILFYYHEGDNPYRIKSRLDHLTQIHNLPPNCYIFISGNSAADLLPQFVAFQDFELWFWHRNHGISACAIHSRPRTREFTVLNRLHKWWRAAVMADLQRHGILERSYWSYCQGITDHDRETDCPIELDIIDLRQDTLDFLASAPYFADSLTQDQRNDHSQSVEHFFTDSYCNIVVETLFDYDQSGGAFISEKTFKPIKNGQLFFVVGGVGSLQLLRNLGYRTFDKVLDTSYDQESNNTQRWIKLRNAIVQAQRQGIDKLFEKSRADIEHNQRLFLANKHKRLSTLLDRIHDKSR